MTSTVESYDPNISPDADEWTATDEGERIALVRDYVQKNEPGIEGEMLHVMAHVMVENQIALGDETPIRAAHDRLMQEGLARHDAIHAIGMAFMELMWESDGGPPADGENDYFRRVESLTAKKWREKS